MNRERLLQLRKHMTKVRPTKHRAFNMDHWFRADVGEVKVKVDNRGVCTNQTECGTAACLLGHAALMPSFQKAGLKLVPQGTYDHQELSEDGEEGITQRTTMQPVYRKALGFDAGAAFFGITDQQARYLFDPSEYPDIDIKPKHAIRHIDAVLSGLVV